MTIGQTSIKLSTVVEHALRRAGTPPEAQTPEIIDTAKNNLFFILTNYANKGMTYWCVQEQFLTLTQGKRNNVLPDGTVDIYNANLRRNTVATGTDVTDSTSITRTFTTSTDVVMFKLDSSFSGIVTINIDGTNHSTITHDGSETWYALDPTVSCTDFKLTAASAATFTEVVVVSSYADVPMYRMNRTDYSQLPSKTTQGQPLQFWYDRQLSPEMVLWPAPNSSSETDCIQYFRNHQISDVGSLTENLGIPDRWLQATIWALAQDMAIELPNTPPERVTLCATMAAQTLNEVQNEERDNSPVSFYPAIGVYSA